MKGFFFNRWPRILWVVFVLSLPGVLIYGFFPKIFECPACYLFEENGDGLKNYYTLVYYVQHDKGWHFSGMNYPYGENIIYTDNQPILALKLRWIDRHIMDLDRHVVGILNMLLLLSIYLAVLVTYKVLRRWGAGRWWSLGSSVFIIFLSPQLLRLQGHYGLAYVVYIPLFILLLDLIVRDTRKRWLWGILSIILVITTSLTHMYWLFIISLMTFSFLICWGWYHRDQKTHIKKVIAWLGVVLVIPVIILLGIRGVTDDIKDRPKEPYGIDMHNATFESTFFSSIPPFDKAWSTVLKQEIPIGEKIAYTGMIGLLMLPAVLYFLVRKRDSDYMNTHVKSFMGMGVVLWLMAAGIFYQYGFKFFWDIIPLLKQFRGLGRFGIAFYYIYLLVCCYLLWRLYIRFREKELFKAGYYLLGAAVLVWGFEAWYNLRSVSEGLFNENHFLSDTKDDYVPLLNAAGHKPEDFQAILQLPLVAVGNETMGVARGFWTLREGIHASMETGLPLIDYSMSRTSVSQGLDIVELISTPYTEKKRAKFFDDRPILLLCEEEFVIPAERKWIDMAQKIGTYRSITLYSLPADVFKTPRPPMISETSPEYNCSGWFNGFEDNKCDTTMSGKGAIVIKEMPQSIWSFTDTSGSVRNWNVSFWSHVDNKKGNVPVPRMMESDPNGTITQNSGLHRESILWSEAYGEWIQVAFPLKTLGKGYRYELFIDQSGPVIDNLMISPEGDTCIVHTGDMILHNNLPILISK